MTDAPLIDSHAHVWDSSCHMVPGARYHPKYEATIDNYLRVLDANGIECAVLVQPSFLGVDNSYLLACLGAHPDRLRGIVVLDPRIGDAELADMNAAGVIGHRYNMVGRDAGILRTGSYRDLTARVTGMNGWTEIQARGGDWPDIARLMKDLRALVMVDHFGLPSALQCPGITALAGMDPARISLKMSAPYRQSMQDYAHAVRRLVEQDPCPALLWGSDWPWTQHEAQHSYRDCMNWLQNWATQEDRRNISSADKALGF
ncbi:MAG: amidohydrolase [Paracoccaceae bacterium]